MLWQRDIEIGEPGHGLVARDVVARRETLDVGYRALSGIFQQLSHGHLGEVCMASSRCGGLSGVMCLGRLVSAGRTTFAVIVSSNSRRCPPVQSGLGRTLSRGSLCLVLAAQPMARSGRKAMALRRPSHLGSGSRKHSA